MSAALVSVSAALVLVLLLLAVPVGVVFRVDRVGALEGQVRLRWLFGLVRCRIGIPGAAPVRPPRAPAGRRGKPKGAGRAGDVFSLLRQPAFRRRVVRLVKDLLRASHPRNLYLRLRIGLGDPADTGRLWALVGPVTGIAASLRQAEIHVEPAFIDSVFEVESHGELRLVPLHVIALAAAFAVSPTSLRAWRSLHRSEA